MHINLDYNYNPLYDSLSREDVVRVVLDTYRKQIKIIGVYEETRYLHQVGEFLTKEYLEKTVLWDLIGITPMSANMLNLSVMRPVDEKSIKHTHEVVTVGTRVMCSTTHSDIKININMVCKQMMENFVFETENEIFKKMKNLADITWCVDHPTHMSMSKYLIDTIINASHIIAKTSTRGRANWLVCHNIFIDYFMSSNDHRWQPNYPNTNDIFSSLYFAGTLDGIRVYCASHIIEGERPLGILGYKGLLNKDTAIQWCPYMPIIFQTAIDPRQFEMLTKIYSKYGLWVMDNYPSSNECNYEPISAKNYYSLIELQ
jgi:hypothetical protein